MLSTALYAKLSSKPPIQPFKKPSTDIVDVGGASAKIKKYVDVLLQLAGVNMAHPLLVVTNISFPLLISTDIMQAHPATMFFWKSSFASIKARVCDMCLEQQTELSP